MSEWIATDDLTVVLGLLLGAVVLLGNLFKPQSLLHPILLGRQSDVDRVRKKGESAVYRNYSTGLVGRVRLSGRVLENISNDAPVSGSGTVASQAIKRNSSTIRLGQVRFRAIKDAVGNSGE